MTKRERILRNQSMLCREAMKPLIVEIKKTQREYDQAVQGKWEGGK